MILLSPGGTAVQRQETPSARLVVGTVEGIFVFERDAQRRWLPAGRGLEGCFVSALTRLESGALIAGTHGLGVARSDDGGMTWRLANAGLSHFDVWVVKAERLGGRERLFAGTLPAHLFVSDDGAASWRELTALGDVPSAPHWSFPPPPHQGHVLDIGVLQESLFVGIEVGALLRSDDGGASFTELPVHPDVSEVDIHRLALHPERPRRIIAATGWGMIFSDDAGASWRRGERLPGIDYPIPLVAHPDDPDLLFVAGGEGWPPNWYQIGRSRAKAGAAGSACSAACPMGSVLHSAAWRSRLGTAVSRSSPPTPTARSTRAATAASTGAWSPRRRRYRRASSIAASRAAGRRSLGRIP